MATRIRLKRFGSKHNPHYRIVVADARRQRNGRAIEELGYYNPTTNPPAIKVNAERAQYWLGVGAQPTDTVVSLFRRAGVLASEEEPQATTAEEAQDATEEVEAPSTEAAEETADAEGAGEEGQDADSQ